MTSSRPYLIRALYEWISDNDMTPYVLVDAGVDDVVVPRQHVEDGKIVLNVSPQAVQNLQLHNAFIEFGARFSGKPMQVHIPVMAILAIYARENGKGMVFTPEDGSEPPPETPDDSETKRPSLRVVK